MEGRLVELAESHCLWRKSPEMVKVFLMQYKLMNSNEFWTEDYNVGETSGIMLHVSSFLGNCDVTIGPVKSSLPCFHMITQLKVTMCHLSLCYLV